MKQFRSSITILSLLLCGLSIWTSTGAAQTHDDAQPITKTFAQLSCTTVTPFGANGNITPTVDLFRTTLGDLNAPEPVNNPDGRRQINWDAAPAAVSDPNSFAGDFFNFNAAPRARGIEFTTPGSGFLLSGDVDDGTPIEFESIDPSYKDEFTTFSAERLFTPLGSNIVEVRFFDPADQTTPATVDGFGAVFTDVDLAGITELRYYDQDNNLIFSISANPTWASTSESVTFMGAHFNDNCVYRVEMTAGNIPLAKGIIDGQAGYDVVVMDDFIYGEPQPIVNEVAIPTPVAHQSCSSVSRYEVNGDINLAVDNFRTALGELNDPAPFNNLDGRRQINWDAAPAAVSDPNSFAGDFFNFNAAPRARGIEFSTAGSGFLLSGDLDDNTPIEFESIDPSYKDEFTTFSAERLFTPIGSNVVEVRFYNPADQITPATVDGFGAVFTDVDLAGTTEIRYYDQADNLIYTVTANPGWGNSSETLTFLGAKFEENCVYRVEITAGNTALAEGIIDGVAGQDVVVMDDFIYGEPAPINLSCGLPINVSQTGDLIVDPDGNSLIIDQFRADLGDLNPFEPTNFPDGRRQINWDAAPAAISDPNDFPGDFFNFNASPRARGIEFETDGDRLLLSGDVDDGTAVRFNSINATYADELTTFSEERLFTPLGSTQVTAKFFSPSDQTTPALVDGFGAIFTDVELSNVTQIQYFDQEGALVWRQAVPATLSAELNLDFDTLQFLGVQFETPCVASVVLEAGNTPLGPNDDPLNNIDIVAMDDFIFGEPQPIGDTGGGTPTNYFTYLPFMFTE